MKGWRNIIVAFLSFLVLGCNTEETEGPFPEIQISEPAENQSFGYLDTIEVKAHIHHQQTIDYVRVAVVDDQSSTVLPVQMFYPLDKEFNLKTTIMLDNLLLESGHLSINIRAGSANGLSNEWVGIYYNAPEKSLKSLLTVTKNAGSGFTVWDLTSDGEGSDRFSFNGDYSGSAVCSKYQQFFKAGSVIDNLSTWDLKLNKISWMIASVPAPPLPYFTALYSDNNEVFYASRDALISGYSTSGINTFRSKQFTNGYFTSIFRYKTWLIAFFDTFNSAFNKLVIFNYPGGTVFRESEVTGTVVSMSDSGDDGPLLFINDDQQSAVFNYSFEMNSLVKLKDFPQGSIRRVSMPEVQDAFLAFTDGIYWYRPATASMVKILPIVHATDLAYDPISGKIFVAYGKVVELYNLNDSEPAETWVLNDSIANIHLLYNK
ncbi:MAG: hypothetical protein AB9834_04495 [Lentimicrobium sp.]